MAKLVTTTISTPDGVNLTLPATDGVAGTFLTSDASGNLSFAATSSAILVSVEGKGNVGSLVTHSDRSHTYSTPEWTSSGPWTNYVNYQASADNNLGFFMNMALGDGMGSGGTTEGWLGDSDKENVRQLEFASGNRLGYYRDMFHYDNNTSYNGITFRIMPVRNTSASAISVDFYGYVSNYWSSGYEGGQLFIIIPNTSTYSTVTSVSTTSLGTISSTNATRSSLSGSYSIPANTTVLVCLTSTDQYQTTYRFKDTNYFYNLSTTFTNSNIICDMRMLSALNQLQFNLPYSGAAQNTSLLAPIWTKTATFYGDR